MPNIDKMKEDADFIKKGLFKIGRNRIAALPANKTWILTDEMESRIARLASDIDQLSK